MPNQELFIFVVHHMIFSKLVRLPAFGSEECIGININFKQI